MAEYLHHKITLADLVDWAEDGIMEGEILEAENAPVRQALAKIGVADVRSFGFLWEDCEQLLNSLGYSARIDVAPA